jgi:hypothetical protein
MKPDEFVLVCASWDAATALAETLMFTHHAEIIDDDSRNFYQIPMVWTSAPLMTICIAIESGHDAFKATLINKVPSNNE